jgi:acetyltransferase-like isoleucine patch superfamily enzyme
LHVHPLYQLLRYNKIKDLLAQNFLLPSTRCVIEIHKTADVKIKGVFRLGVKRFNRSKLESRLLVEADATFETEHDLGIMYGSDIEVFSGATLRFGGMTHTNINCTIICAEKIEIGKGVRIGRNVTIRDNNGGHYINRQNYKNSNPVVIGDKVWLCEGCTIMQGVHIGEGAIVGANAFVTTHVPAHALVMGNPARVVDEDVLWKY